MIYALVTTDSVYELEAHTLAAAIREARACYVGRLLLVTINAQDQHTAVCTVLC